MWLLLWKHRPNAARLVRGAATKLALLSFDFKTKEQHFASVLKAFIFLNH